MCFRMRQEYNAAGRMSPDFHANLEWAPARSLRAPDGCGGQCPMERLRHKFCRTPGCGGQNKVRFTLWEATMTWKGLFALAAGLTARLTVGLALTVAAGCGHGSAPAPTSEESSPAAPSAPVSLNKADYPVFPDADA